jgi:ABC-type transporter Mla subunit MlaD
MGTKPNYFKIGVFVIVAVVLTVAAVIVFGGGLFAQKEIYFETYFDESVSGLNVGAPMEYRGVRMGNVDNITFVPGEYEFPLGSEEFFKYQHLVVVVVSVERETLPAMTLEERMANLRRLIAGGLRVRLATNILTGQAYLQGDYLDPKRFPVLEVPWKPKRPYVPSAPGAFSTLKHSVDEILFKLEKVDTERIGDLIEQILASVLQAVDDANVPELSGGIQNLVATSKQAIEDAKVSAVSSEITHLFAEARATNQRLQKLIASEKSKGQTTNVAEVVAQLNTTLRRIDKLVADQRPQVDEALENLRRISANLEELTENLKKQPSELIFSQPPPKSEVLK